jgi:hypothetical protein
VGVVGAIYPWNGALEWIFHKVGPALLAGCTVDLRSPPQAPGEAYIVAAVSAEIGLPQGVLNIVTCDWVDLRKLEDLSKGQRAIALLLLLLGASTSPLIVDQPEDEFDNRFVYHGVVLRLRELKGSSQIVVSTDNANVPVLGDAELVIRGYGGK